MDIILILGGGGRGRHLLWSQFGHNCDELMTQYHGKSITQGIGMPEITDIYRNRPPKQ